MLGIDPLLCHLWRNVELNVSFCDIRKASSSWSSTGGVRAPALVAFHRKQKTEMGVRCSLTWGIWFYYIKTALYLHNSWTYCILMLVLLVFIFCWITGSFKIEALFVGSCNKRNKTRTEKLFKIVDSFYDYFTNWVEPLKKFQLNWIDWKHWN